MLPRLMLLMALIAADICSILASTTATVTATCSRRRSNRRARSIRLNASREEGRRLSDAGEAEQMRRRSTVISSVNTPPVFYDEQCTTILQNSLLEVAAFVQAAANAEPAPPPEPYMSPAVQELAARYARGPLPRPRKDRGSKRTLYFLHGLAKTAASYHRRAEQLRERTQVESCAAQIHPNVSLDARLAETLNDSLRRHTHHKSTVCRVFHLFISDVLYRDLRNQWRVFEERFDRSTLTVGSQTHSIATIADVYRQASKCALRAGRELLPKRKQTAATDASIWRSLCSYSVTTGHSISPRHVVSVRLTQVEESRPGAPSPPPPPRRSLSAIGEQSRFRVLPTIDENPEN